MVARIGMSNRAAYSIESARVIPQLRTGRHHLEVGGQRAGGHLEAHLVVALAGAAVGHRVGPVAAGHLDQVAHDDRARQGRHQRVAVLVEGVGPQGRAHEVAGELLAAVDHDGVDGPGGQRPGLQGLPVAALADVAGHGDDLDAQLLDHPAHGDGRVEAAAVGQHDSLRHGTPRITVGRVGDDANGSDADGRGQALRVRPGR